MKKRFGSGLPVSWLLTLVVLMGVTSCRTLPERSHPDILDWLPQESDLVLRFSVPGNESLADLLLASMGIDPVEMDEIKQRTALLVLGIETDGTLDSFETLPVHLVAVGVWPRGLMGGALGPLWSRSRRHQWKGPTDLALAALSPEEIFLSRGRLDEMITRREESFAGSLPVSRRNDFPDIDLVVQITNPRFIDTLAPALAGNINRIDFGLKRHEPERYAVFLTLHPADERLTGSLAVAMRIALLARFGMSPNPEERNIISELSLESGPGEIRVEFPPLSMELLKGLAVAINPVLE